MFKTIFKIATPIQIYPKIVVFFSKMKGGLFYLVKFKNKINMEEFEDGSNYYIDGNHVDTTRINICSYL